MGNKAIVFGSFVVDLMSRAHHLPEPGETVKGTVFKMGAGGKGFNQGIAAHKSGADVAVSTKIGNDDFGKFALNALSESGISQEYIFTDNDLPTGTALIGVSESDGQNNIIVVTGASDNILQNEIDTLDGILNESEYLLTQLETNLRATEYIIRKAKNLGVKVILNPAPIQDISDEMLSLVDIITPNEIEAKILTGIEISDEESALKACRWFEEKGVNSTVITLGSRGAYFYENGSGKMVECIKMKAVDSTGAGDAFNGALLTALTENKNLEEAVLFANAAAALSVTKIGTTPAMPERKEIDGLYERIYRK